MTFNFPVDWFWKTSFFFGYDFQFSGWLVLKDFFFFRLLFPSTASGPLRCALNNGGCWKKTQGGKTFSACVVSCFIFFSSVTKFVTVQQQQKVMVDLLGWSKTTLYITFRMIIQKIASAHQDLRVMESITVKVLSAIIVVWIHSANNYASHWFQ